MRRIVGLLLAIFLVAVVVPAIADEDAAHHRPTSDSSNYDVSDDSLCVDDDSLSCFDSGRGAPVWIEVDLGEDTPLKLVRLIPLMHPEGLVNITVMGRTSAGLTFTLANFSGSARHQQAINVPILTPIAVRYLRVNVVGSCSPVAFYSIQAIRTNGTTPTMRDTWGRLKALYK